MYSYNDLSFDSIINSMDDESNVMNESTSETNPTDDFFNIYMESDSDTKTVSYTDDNGHSEVDIKYKKVDTGFIAKVKMQIKKLIEAVMEFINDKIDNLKQSILEKEFDKLVNAAKKSNQSEISNIKVVDHKDISGMVDVLERRNDSLEKLIPMSAKIEEVVRFGDNEITNIEKDVDKVINDAVVYDKTINVTVAAGLGMSQQLYRKALMQNKVKIDYGYIDKLEYAEQVSFYVSIIKLQIRIRKEIMKLLYSSTKAIFSACRSALNSSSAINVKDTSKADDDAYKNAMKNGERISSLLSESCFLIGEIDEDVTLESTEDIDNDPFLQMDFVQESVEEPEMDDFEASILNINMVWVTPYHIFYTKKQLLKPNNIN